MPRGAALVGERARAASRAAAAPRARSPSLAGGVHGRPHSHRRSAPLWGWGRPEPRCGARSAGHRPSEPQAPLRRPQLPTEEGAGTPGLALPEAPAELGQPAARRLHPRPREGGVGPGASGPGSARGASSVLAGGAGRGAGLRSPGHTPAPAAAAGPPLALRAAAPGLLGTPGSERESGPFTSRLRGRGLLFRKECTRSSTPAPPGPKARRARPGEALKAPWVLSLVPCFLCIPSC